MANCHDPLEGWEWDSFLDASLFEQDNHVGAWHGDFPEARPPTTSVLSFPPPASFDFAPVSELLLGSKNVTSSISDDMPLTHNASDGSPISSEYDQETRGSSRGNFSLGKPAVATKKKKRDPRMGCPNFLAGQVPCSCPELDAAEELEAEESARKRPKAAARCQVPSCGGDISHLKGYHQRHRVCLDCANSPKVILRDQPHRYCQQCGKFHRLSDFDEGKRSCRRKLEKHNKRRRRRPVETGEEEQEKQNIVLATEKAYCEVGSSADGSRNTSKKPTIGEHQASDDSTASGLRVELNRKNQKVVAENSLVALLLEGSSDGVDEMSPCMSVNPTYFSRTEQQPRTASSSEKRRRGYVSPCPTGRVSFKLYDWNPADFPRRLRQQIFEWLGNMPVELEGYIRSGCIILTFFITMPQPAWDKMIKHWIEHVQNIVVGSRYSVHGRGHIIARLNEKCVQIKDGNIFCSRYGNKLSPVLVEADPLSLEAGCSTNLYISGFNLQGTKSRFFFSFGEQYIECRDCEPVQFSSFSQSYVDGDNVDGDNKGKLETWKVAVYLPEPKRFGPAYIEVDSHFGVSNAIPVLVADKGVCVEINCLKTSNWCTTNSIGRQCLADLLTDLGWALRYMEEHWPIERPEVRDAWRKRVGRLLLFCIGHGFETVGERLLHMAYEFGLILNTGVPHIEGKSERLNNIFSHVTRDLSRPKYGTEGQHIIDVHFLRRGGNDMVDKFLSSSNLSGDKKQGKRSLLTCRAIICGSRATFASNLEDKEKRSNQKCRTSITNVTKTKQLCLPAMDPGPGECSKAQGAAEGWDVEVPLLERKAFAQGLTLQFSSNSSYWFLNWMKEPCCKLSTVHSYSSRTSVWRIALSTVSVVTLCGGMCFMFQHPHEVVEISMSLRRCLWG